MTDNEIIKALKDEIRRANYIESYYIDCVDIGVFQNALDLINRQKNKIERLKCEMGKLLPKDCSYTMQMEVSNKLESQIKSEAIKEFAERLKEEMRLDDDCNYDCAQCHYDCKDYIPFIDNLVKEMTEVNENDRT